MTSFQKNFILKSTDSKYIVIELNSYVEDVRVYLNGLALMVHFGNDRIKVSPDCRYVNGHLILSPTITETVENGDHLKIIGFSRRKENIW